MHIAHGQVYFHRAQTQQRIERMFDQLMVKRVVQAVLLGMNAASRHPGWHGRIVQYRGEVETSPLPMLNSRLNVEHVDTTDHLVHGAEAELGHVLSHLLGEEEKEVDHLLGLPFELLAQSGVLSCNADGASVEVAFTHHDAAHRD